jgi:ribosome biogenesis GTPase
MAMQGKIIKSIAGFYEVYTGGEIYRCRAKGVFRALGEKPLVGDDVLMEPTDLVSDPKEGNVTKLLPRRNDLIRPNVANVDQALLLFAITHPAPSFALVDRFLIILQQKHLPAVLCFNKQDLATREEIAELRQVYEACGCRVLFLSARGEGEELDAVRAAVRGKTTVITGPSGAGKSTLINALCPGASMETGELSKKIARGKNTTRHVELLPAGEADTFLVDTPGFTSLYLFDTKAEDLKAYYPEFAPYAASCRFHGCNHLSEPGCAVKEACRAGKIPRIRYENYVSLFAELKNQKPDYTKKREGRSSRGE